MNHQGRSRLADFEVYAHTKHKELDGDGEIDQTAASSKGIEIGAAFSTVIQPYYDEVKEIFDSKKYGLPADLFVERLRPFVSNNTSHFFQKPADITRNLTILMRRIDPEAKGYVTWEMLSDFCTDAVIKMQVNKDEKFVSWIHRPEFDSLLMQGASMAVVAPEANSLYAITPDDYVRSWDTQSWEISRRVLAMPGNPLALAHCPAHQRLIVSTSTNHIRMYDTRRLSKISAAVAPQAQTVLEWSGQHSMVVGGSRTGELFYWSVTGGNFGKLKKSLTTAPHAGGVLALACLVRDGNVYSSGMDCAIHLNDVPTGEVLRTAHHKFGPVHAIGYNKVHHCIVTGGNNPIPCVYMAMLPPSAKPFKLRDNMHPHRGSIVSVLPFDSSHVATLDTHGMMKYWDLRTYRACQTLSPGYDEEADFTEWTGLVKVSETSIVACSNNRLLVSSTKDQTSHLKRVDPNYPLRAIEHNSIDSTVATAAGRSVRLWSLRSGTMLSVFENTVHAPVTSMTMDATHRRLFIATTRGVITAHSYVNGVMTNKLTLHSGPVGHLDYCLARDVALLISYGREDKKVIATQIKTQGAWETKLISEDTVVLWTHYDTVSQLYMTLHSDNNLKVWNVNSFADVDGMIPVCIFNLQFSLTKIRTDHTLVPSNEALQLLGMPFCFIPAFGVVVIGGTERTISMVALHPTGDTDVQLTWRTPTKKANVTRIDFISHSSTLVITDGAGTVTLFDASNTLKCLVDDPDNSPPKPELVECFEPFNKEVCPTLDEMPSLMHIHIVAELDLLLITAVDNQCLVYSAASGAFVGRLDHHNMALDEWHLDLRSPMQEKMAANDGRKKLGHSDTGLKSPSGISGAMSGTLASFNASMLASSSIGLFLSPSMGFDDTSLFEIPSLPSSPKNFGPRGLVALVKASKELAEKALEGSPTDSKPGEKDDEDADSDDYFAPFGAEPNALFATSRLAKVGSTAASQRNLGANHPRYRLPVKELGAAIIPNPHPSGGVTIEEVKEHLSTLTVNAAKEREKATASPRAVSSMPEGTGGGSSDDDIPDDVEVSHRGVKEALRHAAYKAKKIRIRVDERSGRKVKRGALPKDSSSSEDEVEEKAQDGTDGRRKKMNLAENLRRIHRVIGSYSRLGDGGGHLPALSVEQVKGSALAPAVSMPPRNKLHPLHWSVKQERRVEKLHNRQDALSGVQKKLQPGSRSNSPRGAAGNPNVKKKEFDGISEEVSEERCGELPAWMKSRVTLPPMGGGFRREPGTHAEEKT